MSSNDGNSVSNDDSNKRPKIEHHGDKKANVLMVGTGEYTTGYVGGTAADSDKGAGVVALTMFDLRRRGKVSRVGMCGVNVSLFLEGCSFLSAVVSSLMFDAIVLDRWQQI